MGFFCSSRAMVDAAVVAADQRVAVGVRFLGDFHADDAARAGAVVHHDLLADHVCASSVPTMRLKVSTELPGAFGTISRIGRLG